MRNAQPADPVREEWLRARKLGVGGSDVHHVFNDKPEGCARQLSYDKLDVPPDFPEELAENEPMRGGRVLERFVVEDYGERTGRTLLTPENPYVHPEHAFVRVNVDALLAPVADHDGPGVLEVKTVNAWLYRKIQLDGLKAGHIRQDLWGMLAAGTRWGAFAVAQRESALLAAVERLQGIASPKPIEMVYFDVERDDELLAHMLPEAATFWAMVERGELAEALPQIDDRCRRCAWRVTCRGRHLTGKPPSYEKAEAELFDSEELDAAIGDYLVAKAERDGTEQRVEDAKEAIIVALGGREAVRTRDGASVSYRQQTRLSWDGRALERCEPFLRVDDVDRALAVLKDCDVAAQAITLKNEFLRAGEPFRVLRVHVK